MFAGRTPAGLCSKTTMMPHVCALRGQTVDLLLEKLQLYRSQILFLTCFLCADLENNFGNMETCSKAGSRFGPCAQIYRFP